ncbi:MAG: response regulator [Ignavibacteriales bacterium]|nr:response regulator [Ignavibacteriales bacterium]
MEQPASQNKLAARQCLMAADKFIKDSQFVEAKKEIEKAKSLDPTNLYISAFIDRINYFEKEKSHSAKSAKPIPAPKVPSAQTVVPAQKPPAQNVVVPQAPKQTAPQQVKQPAPTNVAPPKKAVEPVELKQPAPSNVAPPKKAVEPVEQKQPAPPKTIEPPPIENPIVENRTVEIETPKPQRTPDPVQVTPKIAIPDDARVDSPVVTPSLRNQSNEHAVTETQFEEMKRKIDLLTKALEDEKKAREDMNRQQIQQAITQFRGKLEKAWAEGAPSEQKLIEFDQLAVSLSIPENVVRTIQREVKIEMYGRAVKEVISKRQLLRSSSSTLEWLRKVYKISMEEYLEYESKFLMDLVADQYKGTILQISADDQTKKDITPRLKSMGYAVVTSPSPEDALEKIDKLNPNVIICESSFGAGSISGIRFLHILRTNSKFSYIPFIFLSTEEDYALLTSSELRPNEGFVKKPSNFDELSVLINTKLLWFREYIMSLSK